MKSNNVETSLLLLSFFTVIFFSQSSCSNSNKEAEYFIGEWQSTQDADYTIVCSLAGEYFEITQLDYREILERKICIYDEGCFVPLGSKQPFVCKNVNGGLVFGGVDYYLTNE